MAADDEENSKRSGRVMSLSTLQSLMKKDPEAYESEFAQQWSHFDSMVEIFKLKPQKPHKSFCEQVMFLAHVIPSFPSKGAALPGVLINALDDHYQVMHAEMRQTLVAALIMLRNRGQFPLIQTLPLYFKLFTVQDKSMRNAIFSHIVKDLVQMTTMSRNQKTTVELRDFFFGKLKESDVEISRRACAVFISLYRQNCWRDHHVINLISAGLLHPDVKISAALCHLFLGNKTKGLEGILEDSDDEPEEKPDETIQGLLGSKKTANREKRIKRAKKAIQKAKLRTKKAHKGDSSVSFVAIDLLNDPQTLAERCLQRIQKGSEPFLYRLLLLHLVARLVGRHTLHLLNLYPFLMKYMVPSQHEVTKILACLVEASHSQVPPDELRPVVLHLMQTFVTESAAPEVIEVGLNTIREICTRAVNILTEEELTDLVTFKKFKHKGVMVAARSLINAYREIDPQLLHRSLRGREATMALSRGEVQAPQFGVSAAREAIDGLELLAKSKEKHRDNDRDTDSAAGAVNATQLMGEGVLSTEDFKKMRKLQLQKSVETQLGRKRKAEEISSSGSGSDSDEDGSDSSDEEQGLYGRMPDGISADQLKGTKKKGRTKAERKASAESGRTDFKEKLKEKHANRKGGQTNKEKRRNKPLMMGMQSRRAKSKKNASSRQKMRNLKSHIKTLTQKVGGKQKRRR
jgi:protein SDA1